MQKETPMIHVHDASTGADMQREMTPEEIAEHEAHTADSPSLPTE